jgi:arylsulfatase A-like enzyme
MTDYQSVSYAIEQLNRPHDKPLFLACGLHKPHMPWNVPRKYYDLYPLDQIQLPKVLETDLDDVPPAGVKMARPDVDHAKILASGRWKEAVQSYLASITFCDAMVGRLLDGFDKSPYAENTIVVLWGDHGWHLGEKQHWRKFALWEEATRAPLIFVVPGVTKPASVCDRTVDFMSIYPTLTDLCGLSTPAHVEGQSIRRLLQDPKAAWDQPAITTHGYKNHAVRTEGWRYIRYADGGEELYDEAKDPREWVNLAGKPELASVKSDLAHWLPTNNTPAPAKAAKRDKKSDPGPGKQAKQAARKAAKQAKPAE